MKFTRLRVLGFKSFVEPTELVIEPGLTGVVGPNGCGKSNLVEALRWVMGESSYKNMRASGMDDVIFSGSGNRPPRNMAEVTLQIDNTDRLAPAAFNDSEQLDITRRIEREAGSAYKINGRDVRARDVQLLFADASTGAHSPAMVGQGKIGELIAAKPQARRALLEEAAGISGLHNRRHEAELRLKAAEQNLERLDDVVSEIETQLEMLKRQARQAVRYRNLSGEIRKAEATVLHLRWLGARAALAEAEAAFSEAGRLQGIRAEEQATAARNQAVAGSALPALRDDAAKAGAALHRMTVARETLDNEERRVRERLALIERQLAQLGDDLTREERMLADNAAILVRLDEEEAGLVSANEAMSERQANATARRHSAESTLTESEGALTTTTQQLAEITARRGQFERVIREAEGRVERHRREAASVEGEYGQLELALSGLASTETARNHVESAEIAVQSAEQDATAAEQRTVVAREKQSAAREALSEAERAFGRVDAEANALAKLLASAIGAGAQPILDAVKVDGGFETALGAAFGDDLDASADETAPAHWRAVSADGSDPAPP